MFYMRMSYRPCVTVLGFDGMAGSETPTFLRTAELLKLLRDDCKARYHSGGSFMLGAHLHLTERLSRNFDVTDGNQVHFHYIHEITHLHVA